MIDEAKDTLEGFRSPHIFSEVQEEWGPVKLVMICQNQKDFLDQYIIPDYWMCHPYDILQYLSRLATSKNMFSYDLTCPPLMCKVSKPH